MELDELRDDGFGFLPMLALAAGTAAGAAVLALAGVKVRNELLMTKAYVRQADALERIADEAERGHVPVRFTGIAVKSSKDGSCAYDPVRAETCSPQPVPRSGYWPKP